MNTTDAANDSDRAEQSCASCKRLKRRCSKDLPTCLLCSRVGRRCDYSIAPVTPMRTDPDSSTARVETRSGTPSSFLFRSDVLPNPFVPPTSPEGPSDLATCFLDSVAMRGVEAALPCNLLWRDVCSGLGEVSADEAASIADRYFSTTHSWFPIVSKLRVLRSLRNAQVSIDADVQILLHAMRLDHDDSLASQRPSGDEHAKEQRTRYQQVKTALFAIEQSARFSTNFLAAHALLVLHEIGHGIFPAAYLAVGNLARLFCALGLHDRKKATQILPRPETWSETEERRRLWWAVLILDRYVHIGFRFRPLCTPKIPPDEILPARDAAWDTGELTVNPLLVMSIEASTSVDPFARTCQASHLLGWVCEHVNQHTSSEDADMHFQEAFTISGALRALLTMLHSESARKPEAERQKLFAARGIAYAALNTLYDVHSCIEPDNVESVGGNRGLRLDLQQHALDGFKEVIAEVSTFAAEIEQYGATHGFDRIPVLVLFSMYTVAGTYAWYARENAAEVHLAALENLRRVMRTIGRSKWRVGSLYVKMLEGQEYSYQGACFQ